MNLTKNQIIIGASLLLTIVATTIGILVWNNNKTEAPKTPTAEQTQTDKKNNNNDDEKQRKLQTIQDKIDKKTEKLNQLSADLEQETDEQKREEFYEEKIQPLLLEIAKLADEERSITHPNQNTKNDEPKTEQRQTKKPKKHDEESDEDNENKTDENKTDEQKRQELLGSIKNYKELYRECKKRIQEREQQIKTNNENYIKDIKEDAHLGVEYRKEMKEIKDSNNRFEESSINTNKRMAKNFEKLYLSLKESYNTKYGQLPPEYELNFDEN